MKMELVPHSVTLYGERITLRPLTEADWPILMRWNTDPEVLYYSEGDDVQSYTLEDVQGIYRSISQQGALCFIIEFQGRPVGDCWLQPMNLERVLAEFPGFDVRRIDLIIGEKALWGQGFGTEVIRVLMAYAFQQLDVDYLYEPGIADYNIRSQRAFEKNGHHVVARNPEPPGMKASFSVDMMAKNPRLGFRKDGLSQIIAAPFAWCVIDAGLVTLEDASAQCGTPGGSEMVAAFWMAKYPVTNAQFQGFIDDPVGYRNRQWWEFSPQARQWRVDHPRPRATAFPGDQLPRTRVSWFECVAFCNWLTAGIVGQSGLNENWVIRLPTEQEWQWAAVGDTGWIFPWGNTLDHLHANYGKEIGRPTPVNQYPQGQSAYGVFDLIGNVWERCLSAWGKEPAADLAGYTYRAMRGGAWNVSQVEVLSARLRYGHPPRGQLNDAGFRVVYAQSPERDNPCSST